MAPEIRYTRAWVTDQLFEIDALGLSHRFSIRYEHDRGGVEDGWVLCCSHIL